MNVCRLLVVAGFVFLQSAGSLFAENGGARNQLRVKELSVDLKDTPEYSVNADGNDRGEGTTRDKKWLVLRANYETAPTYLDEVTFTYYVALEAENLESVKSTTREKINVFTGSVTYEHVAKGKHTSTFFMHPHLVARYGKVKQAAVLVTVKGAVAGIVSEPNRKSARWWEKFSPIKGHLLGRDQTPFKFSEFDSYEMIKKN